MVRRIIGVKRADQRKVDEITVEVGVKGSFKKKLVRSRPSWASHVNRMGDEKLTNGADAQKVERKRRRGRRKWQWELY